MAKKKYYAVRKGFTTGIFETWEECKNNVNGYSGAEYKSFPTLEEAMDFVENSCLVRKKSENAVDIYVDGSYRKDTNEFSYGMVVLYNGAEYTFGQKFSDEELASMNNVAGEIKGAEAAMQYALDNNIEHIRIYHDYEGIAKWCTQAWKATKPGTIKYVKYYNSVKDKINIEFVKVKGHSSDKYNDMADALAKEALGI